MRKVALAFLILIFCMAEMAHAATSISVGNYVLLPNTPNQEIQIFVTGGDQIQGMNLNAQIGPDPSSAITPVFQYDANQHLVFPGANLSTLLAPGSIFSPPAGFGENDVTFFPALWQAGSATSSGTVAANGLLAKLYIDTTGFFPLYTDQVWALNLFDTIGGPTDWAGSLFQGNEVPNPIITDGTIRIVGVPEPSAVVIAMFGVAGLVAFAIRRPARRNGNARRAKTLAAY